MLERKCKKNENKKHSVWNRHQSLNLINILRTERDVWYFHVLLHVRVVCRARERTNSQRHHKAIEKLGLGDVVASSNVSELSIASHMWVGSERPKALIVNPNWCTKGANALVVVCVWVEAILDDGRLYSRFIPELFERGKIVDVADAQCFHCPLVVEGLKCPPHC